MCVSVLVGVEVIHDNLTRIYSLVRPLAIIYVSHPAPMTNLPGYRLLDVLCGMQASLRRA